MARQMEDIEEEACVWVFPSLDTNSQHQHSSVPSEFIGPSFLLFVLIFTSLIIFLMEGGCFSCQGGIHWSPPCIFVKFYPPSHKMEGGKEKWMQIPRLVDK